MNGYKLSYFKIFNHGFIDLNARLTGQAGISRVLIYQCLLPGKEQNDEWVLRFALDKLATKLIVVLQLGT